VFETNIRFVGGLLAAYALTGDQVGEQLVFLSITFPVLKKLQSWEIKWFKETCHERGIAKLIRMRCSLIGS
jgi:hypothetical protein